MNKAERVHNLAKNINYEVGVLAHSCGVRHPRALQRHHALMINEVGIPEPIDTAVPALRLAEGQLIATDRSEVVA
jgi:hypothetical protein